MHLKSDIDLTEFLIAVSSCNGDVLFTTPDGDLLNLKSTLSRYVFVTAAMHPEMLSDGSIICKKQEDVESLHAFVTLS